MIFCVVRLKVLVVWWFGFFFSIFCSVVMFVGIFVGRIEIMRCLSVFFVGMKIMLIGMW